MFGVLRRGMALACVVALLALPAGASAHTDPFASEHTHPVIQQASNTGNGAALGIGVAALLLASAAGLVALKRVGAR